MLLTSYMGFPSVEPVVRATWTSFGARTLKRSFPDVTAVKVYSNLSSVLNSVDK